MFPYRATAGQRRKQFATPAMCSLALIALLIAGAVDAAALRRGAFGEPEGLAPRESGVSSEQTILRDLFEGLTTPGPAGEIVPGAAESWTVSADGRHWRFRLRPGLRWSDGHELVAGDFVYGWQRSMAPATAAARASRLYVLRHAREIHEGRAAVQTLGARAPDVRTLELELEYPLPWLPLLFSGEDGFPLPRHVIEAHGPAWTRAGLHVGNGAFRLSERRPRGAIVLNRNPYFHDARHVALDTVTYLPADDPRELVQRFRAGELDVNGWPGFNPRQQAALQSELRSQVHVTPLASLRYLRFNLRRAPFDDPRVRTALSLAVDRDLLVTRVMTGGETASLRVVPNGVEDDRPVAGNGLAAGNPAARLARARALLLESHFREKHPGPIRIRGPSGNGEELCLAVAAMWSAAGAPTQLDRSEIKSMIADLRRGDFDVALTGAQDYPTVESYLERFRAGSSYNTGRYAGPQFEPLLDAATQMADPAARAQGLQAAEAVLSREHPVVPLIQEVARNLVATRVRGWVDNPSDIHLSRYLSLQ
jgi:oligopeptide transport system substrate-binding protein